MESIIHVEPETVTLKDYSGKFLLFHMKGAVHVKTNRRTGTEVFCLNLRSSKLSRFIDGMPVIPLLQTAPFEFTVNLNYGKKMNLELCKICGEPTGKAGVGEETTEKRYSMLGRKDGVGAEMRLCEVCFNPIWKKEDQLSCEQCSITICRDCKEDKYGLIVCPWCIDHD